MLELTMKTCTVIEKRDKYYNTFLLHRLLTQNAAIFTCRYYQITSIHIMHVNYTCKTNQTICFIPKLYTVA